MKGKNQLVLCTSEMIEAIQFYLNEKVFTKEHKAKVTAIEKKDQGNFSTTFILTLQDEENEKE